MRVKVYHSMMSHAQSRWSCLSLVELLVELLGVELRSSVRLHRWDPLAAWHEEIGFKNLTDRRLIFSKSEGGLISGSTRP